MRTSVHRQRAGLHSGSTICLFVQRSRITCKLTDLRPPSSKRSPRSCCTSTPSACTMVHHQLATANVAPTSARCCSKFTSMARRQLKVAGNLHDLRIGGFRPSHIRRLPAAPVQGLFDKKEFDYIETSENLPEPGEDMWANEKFEVFGQLLKYAVPLVGLGVILVGGFASSQYNEGADRYLAVAPSDESTAIIVEAKDVQSRMSLD